MPKSDLPTHRSALCLAALSILSLFLGGCGGGGGGTTPPADDFLISVSPKSLTVGIGGSQTVAVSATQINTFAATISVSVSGLPAGVTANPATFSVTAGNQQQVTITAAASAQPITANLTFLGTSGNLSHSTFTALSIIAPVTGAHPPIRTRYLRTNSFYDPNNLQYNPPHFTVYDAAHKQFFVSNPFLNEIDVFDAVQEIETARISVPTAWGLDISPYNGSLYAGTLIGDIYQIDTSALSVIKRYPAASIGPNGFTAQTALVLSDGRLALQGSGEWVVLGYDGYGPAAVWDPVTNSLDAGELGSICVNEGSDFGAFAVSGDRTRVLVGGQTVCSYDPIAKVATYGTSPSGQQIIPSPDGSRFFSTGETVGVFDAKTVQLLSQIGLPDFPSSAVISLDGKTLYLVDQLSAAVWGYDTTSLTQTGWVPSFTVDDLQGGIVISAIDETGLIAGPIGHGVGFIDASAMTPTQSTFFNPGYANPPTGPLTGGTSLSGFASGKVADSAVLDRIYVGNVPGTSAGFSDTAVVVTPAANQSGAVDLAVLLNDGGVGIVPEGFSYGPTILEVVPNGATAEGGQTGAIIGYGFGDSTSGIQVTVGGQAAPVTAVNKYGAPIIPYPFPTSSLQFTIPPGTAGTVVNVTVTTPSGSFTATGAFHYTAAVQSFPVAANLQAGIYDARRDLYYFADQSQIQVLSKSTGWLSPIALPNVSSGTQLLAISESPDGSHMAVSDYGGQAIYVLNPDNPASVTRYPMSLDHDGGFAPDLAPSGLAVTDSGTVYFASADINGTGAPSFHKLNTAANSISDIGYPNGSLSSASLADKFDRVFLSADGSKVYSSQSGDVTNAFWIDTSNNQSTYSPPNYLSLYADPDLAISGDGNTLEAAGELTDSLLNPETQVAYIDWETWFPLAVDGQKLNQDGSIMFQPLTDGVDMLARDTGRLLYRIQIPLTVPDVYDALVVAEGQNTLAVISANAVSFVDLSSLPIASKYTQPFPDTIHSKTSGTADRNTVPLTNRPLSTRSNYRTARPTLRRIPDEQPKAHVRTP